MLLKSHFSPNLMFLLTVREMWTSLCNFLCKNLFHKPEINFQRSNGSCDSVYGKRLRLNISITDANSSVNQSKSYSMQEGNVDVDDDDDDNDNDNDNDDNNDNNDDDDDDDDDEDCCIIAEIPKRKVPGNSVGVPKSSEFSPLAQNSQKCHLWSTFLFHNNPPATEGLKNENDEVEFICKSSGRNDNSKKLFNTKKFFMTQRASLINRKSEKLKTSFRHRLKKRINFLQESYRLTEKFQYMQLLQSLTSHDLFTLRPSPKSIKDIHKKIEVIDLCNEKTSEADINQEKYESEDQDIEIVKEISGVWPFQDTFKVKPLNAEIAIKKTSPDHHNNLNVLNLPDSTINILDDEDSQVHQFTDALEEKLRNFMQITGPEIQEVESTEPCYLPELMPEQEKKIRYALMSEPQDEVLSQGFGIHITRQDMQTLVGLNWLNDEIINFYMNLIIERSKLNKKLPKVYAFNTFFYPKLVSSGYSSLSRWTKQVDIFAYDIILVPIHLKMHWCLAVIDFRHKSVKYYDSVGSPNNACLERLMIYLKAESLDKKRKIFPTTNWEKSNVKDIPQQMNGGDCGVFSCMFAEHLARDCIILFTQDDMPYFRKKMVIEILEKKLLT